MPARPAGEPAQRCTGRDRAADRGPGGDVVRIGKIRIGAGATVGSRSTLLPGARIGKGTEIAAGSTVPGAVPAGQRWAGSPAGGPARPACPGRRPGRALAALGARLRRHVDAPRAAARGGGAARARDHRGRGRRHGVPRGGDGRGAAAWSRPRRSPTCSPTPRSSWPGCACSASAWRGLPPGAQPRGLAGLDHRAADGHGPHGLFPLYASQFTAAWLRLLGAKSAATWRRPR